MDGSQPPKKRGIALATIGVLLFGGIVAVAASSEYSTSLQSVPTIAPVETSVTSTVSPVSSPPDVFTTYLAEGSSGTAVANLQQFLSDEGLYSGPDSGYFDIQTRDAVMAFQEQEGITPINGVWEALAETHANRILAAHPDWVTTLSNSNSYENVNGATVHSPAQSSNGVPAGASAVCRDGTFSFSMHHRGTCSHHGGVAQWLN